MMATDTQPQIRTRPAELRDAEILHKIINAAYRSDKCWTNESKLVRDERVTLDGLRDMIEAGRDPILVALSDEEFIYWVDSGNHPDLRLPEDSAMLGLLAVNPDYQSRGVGKALFNEAVEMVKTRWSCTKAVMWVINKRADIQAWYERLGFKWNGEKRDFVLPDKVLQDDIWFKVYVKELY